MLGVAVHAVVDLKRGERHSTYLVEQIAALRNPDLAGDLLRGPVTREFVKFKITLWITKAQMSLFHKC